MLAIVRFTKTAWRLCVNQSKKGDESSQACLRRRSPQRVKGTLGPGELDGSPGSTTANWITSGKLKPLRLSFLVSKRRMRRAPHSQMRSYKWRPGPNAYHRGITYTVRCCYWYVQVLATNQITVTGSYKISIVPPRSSRQLAYRMASSGQCLVLPPPNLH